MPGLNPSAQWSNRFYFVLHLTWGDINLEAQTVE